MIALMTLILLQEEKPVRLVPYTAERRAHAPSGALMGRTETEEERKVREALETARISVDFSGTPLSDVADSIRSFTGLNVVVSEGGDLPVDLRLNDVKVRTLLDLLRGYDVGWYVGEGFIKICSRDEENRRRTELRTYDLRDLLVRILDFPGEVLVPMELDTAPPISFEMEEPGAVTVNEDMIAELIQVSIEPESWDSSYDHTIDLMGGVLFVRHTPEVQAQVEAFIEGLRSRSQIQIVTEAQLMAMTEAELEAARKNGPAVERPTGALLGAADVICFNTQRTTASRFERRTHVGAYEANVADGSAQAEPKSRVVNEGVQLDVRPIASADRRSVTLELRFDMTDVTSMKIAKTAVGDLDQPQVTTYTLNSTISIPSGSWVIVGGLGDYLTADAEPRRAVLVVRSTIYGLED